MLELIKRFLERLCYANRELWVVLEIDGGLPYFITWTPDKAEAIEHYKRCCDAVGIPYDDPHSIEVDVFLFHGKRNTDLAEYIYSEADQGR